MNEQQVDRVISAGSYQIATPTYVQIEPVGQCNLRCKMCPINFREDKPLVGTSKMMQYELYTRLVDQFTNLKTLHLQGLGEPMLHPRFFDMIEYAAQKGIRVTTNTNLTLLNEKKAERCITSGLETLHFSIDGTKAETYENIRINANFKRVMSNLKTLVDTKRSMSAALPHLKMVIVIMRQNLAELPDLVRLASQYGAEEVFAQQLSHDFGDPAFNPRYQPLHDYVDQQSLMYEEPQRVEEYFGQARDLAKELGVKLRLPRTKPRQQPLTATGPERCDWPWARAYISFQGYAMPCCMTATPEQINLGLISGDNLEKVWNGEPYRHFRDQLASNQPPEICRLCSVYNGTF
jgi:MoaA/NifB/PqqE/SkfB family radical SAM enzyme